MIFSINIIVILLLQSLNTNLCFEVFFKHTILLRPRHVKEIQRLSNTTELIDQKLHNFTNVSLTL